MTQNASVSIIIDADDRASKKVADASRKIEQNVKAIKETGQKAKASTEFVGTLANLSGGNAIGSFAQQIAGLTEKTSQFAEVSKLGGAGALAFKAGLLGAAAVISYNVGKALGDVIFQTEKWKEKLAEATEESKKLGQRTLSALDNSRSLMEREISLLPKDDQRAAREKALEEARKSADRYGNQIRALKKELDSWGWAWLIGGRQSEEIKNELQQAETFLESYRKQIDAMNAQVSERARDIKLREEQKAVEELIKAEKERLALMDAEIKHGKEVTRILELQKKGVDAKTAAELAAHEQRLAMMQRETQDLQATESRTLTRSPNNQDWLELRKKLDEPVQTKSSSDIARDLETVLERMTKLFGEEIAKGFKEQPKIALEKL